MPVMTTSDEQKQQWRVKDAAGVVHIAPTPYTDESVRGRVWACVGNGNLAVSTGRTRRDAVATWASTGPLHGWTEIAEPGQLFASEQVEAARADERQRLAQSMNDMAAFALAQADKITGVVTRDEYLHKVAFTSQHFSLLAWEKSIRAGKLSDEPVRPSTWPADILDDVSIIGEE